MRSEATQLKEKMAIFEGKRSNRREIRRRYTTSHRVSILRCEEFTQSKMKKNKMYSYTEQHRREHTFNIHMIGFHKELYKIIKDQKII